jgi:hypothetical protein
MEKKYLIGAGVIALGLFAYSRYAKKDESGQGEEQGGGGGGGFGGGAFVTPTSPTASTPSTSVAKTSGGVQPIKITNPTVLAGLGAGKPVSAPIGSKNLSNSGIGIYNQAGITGIPNVKTSSASTTSSGMGSVSGVGIQSGSTPPTMTGTAGGTVFKPFSGGESNGKTPIYLNDLVRSWNRP